MTEAEQDNTNKQQQQQQQGKTKSGVSRTRNRNRKNKLKYQQAAADKAAATAATVDDSAAVAPQQQQQQQQQQDNTTANNVQTKQQQQRNNRRGGGTSGEPTSAVTTKQGDAPSGSGSNRNKNRNRNRNRNKEKQAAEAKAKEEAAARKRALQEEEAKKRAEEEAERKRLAEIAALEEKKRQHEAAVHDAMNTVNEFCNVLMDHAKSREELGTGLDGSMNPWLVKARAEHNKTKKNLKSDLKKCTAFVKKVKTMTTTVGGGSKDGAAGALVKDIQTLNLSRYVEEIASAILEAKVKMVDVPAICLVVKAMHERYAEFLPSLLSPMQDALKGKGGDKVDAKEAAKQRRLYTRMMTEFLLTGIVSEPKLVLRVLADTSGAPKDSSSADNNAYNVSDATLIVSFAKAAGYEMMGALPRSVREAFEVVKIEAGLLVGADSGANTETETDNGLSIKAQGIIDIAEKCLGNRAVSDEALVVVETHSMGSYRYLTSSLVQTHAKLRKLEKRCEQDRLLNGALSEAREKGLSDATKLFDNLLKSVESLSESLDLKLPTLKEEVEVLEEGERNGLELWTKEEDVESSDWGPFDDEETWSFYCDVPDLITTIPPALLGFTQDQLEAKQASNAQKYGEEEGDGDDDVVETSSGEQPAESESADMLDEDNVNSETKDGDKDDGEIDKDTPHYKLMVLLDEELPEVHCREKTDETAEKFVVNHGSNKNSRKRLTKNLFLVPRTRLDLLPQYSRVAAIIDRVYDDVTKNLVTDLEAQFHGYARFKKNVNVEGRFKNARFIGELTKFRAAPPIVALRGLQRCLEDFSGANIDIACCILETCGRFLYRSKHTKARISSLMETMMRLRKAKNLEEKYVALIDSAFYNVMPPMNQAAVRKVKVLPPIEAYIKYLLMEKLTPDEAVVSFITKQLMRLDWNDPNGNYGALICKYMLKAARKGRYTAACAVAMLTEKLKKSRAEVPVRLVDAVFEGLQFALEVPSFRDQQRTISLGRLLGELFKANLIPSAVIFDELYHFIDFGHEIPVALREISLKEENKSSDVDFSSPSMSVMATTIAEDEEMDEDNVPVPVEDKPPAPVAVSQYSKFDPRVPCLIDGPTAVLRIKLVCTVLDTAGSSLISLSNQGNNNLIKLQRFLTCFQRYLFTKSVLPTEVEFATLDLFDSLDSFFKATQPQQKKNSKAVGGADEKFCVPRYDNWVSAHQASVAAEEAEALAEERGKQRLLAQGGDLGDESDSGDDSDDDDDENSLTSSRKESRSRELSGDNSDNESLSESSIGLDDESMGASDSEDDGDDDTSTSSDGSGTDEFDEDDDEMKEAAQQEAYMRQLEEEAFERELRKLTLDAIEKGKSAARAGANAGKVADTMVHASQIVVKKSDGGTATVPKEGNDNATPSALGGFEGMTFKLLKRGHKGRLEAKKLIVPTDTNLAKQAIKQDDEEAREREMLKAKVLQYEAESNEQEISGGNLYIDQSKLTVIRNRPLSFEEIERNFGKDGGSDGKWGSNTATNTRTTRISSSSTTRTPSSNSGERRTMTNSRGRGGGRYPNHGGRGSGGRTLRTW